jgi:hypothetical protein
VAYIKTISPAKATGETREVYTYGEAITGFSVAANIVQLFSLRPESMRRMIRSWELSMWMGEQPRAKRELLASAVSRYNDCHY